MKTRLLIAFAAVIVLLALTFSTTLPLGAAGPVAQIWDCANGPTAPGGTCDTILGGQITHGWNATGNIGSTSHYNYGDTVPWRITMTGLTAGQPVVIIFDYSFVDGAGFSWDRMNTWNTTVKGGPTEPCVGTPLAGTSCVGVSFPLPTDPVITNAGSTCPASFHTEYVTNYKANPGLMYGYGMTAITNVEYVSSNHTCSATTNTDVGGVRVTFTPTGTDAVLVVGLHVATVVDWGQVASNNQSPYHSNLVSWTINGAAAGGLNNQQLQMKLNPVATAVTLSKFIGVNTVKPSLTWTTGSEIDTAGFNVYRSESADGPYVRINGQLIPSSSSLTGGQYQYQDASAESGHAYYYQLEDVELNGTSVRHSPILVTAAASTTSANPLLLVGSVIGAILVVGAAAVALKKLAR